MIRISRIAQTVMQTLLISPSPSLPRRLLSGSSSRFSQMDYSVKEVQIPVPVPNSIQQGYVAGRLFQGTTTGSSSGPEHPPLICVHGWGDTAASFDPILPQIVSGRNLTALSFDMTGHGKSSHPLGPYTDLHSETLLTILRLIRFYKWDKVTLMGHSFGGLVSLSFTATFPELVHSFIGLDILPAIAFGMKRKDNFLALTQYATESILDIEKKIASGKPAPEYTREEMIERMQKGRARQGGLTREGCDMLIDRNSIVQPNGKLIFSHDPRGQAFFLGGLMNLGSNFNMFAKNVKCPTLLINIHQRLEDLEPEVKEMIAGNKGRLEELVETLRNNITKFEVAKVEATHHAHMLNPELVSPIVNNYIKSTI